MIGICLVGAGTYSHHAVFRHLVRDTVLSATLRGRAGRDAVPTHKGPLSLTLHLFTTLSALGLFTRRNDHPFIWVLTGIWGDGRNPRKLARMHVIYSELA